MPKYITIIDGQMEAIEAPEPMPLELMQKIVGGYIENPQRYPSPDRAGYTVDVWCNDDRHGLEPNVYSYRLADVIHGPIIIAAATPDGNTVGLSEAEMQTVLVFHWWHRAQVPVMDLRYREKEPASPMNPATPAEPLPTLRELWGKYPDMRESKD